MRGGQLVGRPSGLVHFCRAARGRSGQHDHVGAGREAGRCTARAAHRPSWSIDAAEAQQRRHPRRRHALRAPSRRAGGAARGPAAARHPGRAPRALTQHGAGGVHLELLHLDEQRAHELAGQRVAQRRPHLRLVRAHDQLHALRRSRCPRCSRGRRQSEGAHSWRGEPCLGRPRALPTCARRAAGVQGGIGVDSQPGRQAGRSPGWAAGPSTHRQPHGPPRMQIAASGQADSPRAAGALRRRQRPPARRPPPRAPAPPPRPPPRWPGRRWRWIGRPGGTLPPPLAAARSRSAGWEEGRRGRLAPQVRLCLQLPAQLVPVHASRHPCSHSRAAASQASSDSPTGCPATHLELLQRALQRGAGRTQHAPAMGALKPVHSLNTRTHLELVQHALQRGAVGLVVVHGHNGGAPARVRGRVCRVSSREGAAPGGAARTRGARPRLACASVGVATYQSACTRTGGRC